MQKLQEQKAGESGMIYIGIDPGKKGAMAILQNGEVKLIPFDEMEYINYIEAAASLGTEIKCCLEHVNAMPGQGVTSMFSFGENFGFIRGVLQAYSIPYELVRPQKWKKEYSITADKNDSVSVCKRLFPQALLKRTKRCKKDDDGIAEALLMAEYARRRL